MPVEALLLPLRMPLFCSFEIIALVGCGIKGSLFFNAGKAPNPCMRVPCGFPFEGLDLVLEEQHRTDLMLFQLLK